jgi:hypothetical protein
MHIPISRFTLPLVIALVLGAGLLLPAGVQAQCGTQASSCKNCHEVQGQDPVNTEGDWHVQHAFGDFCEFCHAGNVTVMEPDAAHTAMIYPLSDPKGSCSSCHTDNYQDLAGQYASVLGVELDTVVAPTEGAVPTSEAISEPAAATEEAAVSAPEEPTGGQIVDFNNRYADFTSTNAPAKPINTGNVILSFMLVGLVGTFGALAWKFEGFDKRWAQLRGTKRTSTQPALIMTGSPAVDALLPALSRANPATLASLNRILEGDPQRGGQLIEALARIDPRLVEIVRRLSEQDLELLVALVRELNERS